MIFNDQLASFSGYGSFVDIAAPGVTTIVVTATDAAGNSTSQQIQVTKNGK